MADLKTNFTCPLGSKCVEIKNNEIYQCYWHIKLQGRNPNDDTYVDEEACALRWIPMLMIENSLQQKSTSAAVESFRNEMVKASETNQQILLTAIDITPNIKDISNTDKKLIGDINE